MTNIISQRLREKISSLPQNSVVVLKGVPLNFVDDKNFPADLDAANKNPLDYFMRLTADGRKFFTHEEFILLSPAIFMKYDAAHVINNNLFAELYPIAAKLSDATKKILLDHFAEPDFDIDEPETENLGDVSRLVDIFVELKTCGDFLVGGYNDEQLLSDPRVKVVNLFDDADVALAEVDSSAAQNFIDLQTEFDFVDFVREIIYASPKKIFVRTHNYTGDKSALDGRLKIIAENFSATKILRVRPEKFKHTSESRAAYKKILKRYWNFDAFRNFSVYDLPKLDDGIKRTFYISQEQIISDIVAQVERCIAGKNFRDIFVTAPTGAGKSVIFQIPAIYLAERFKLLTIVVSPLIALMNDHVINLGLKSYDGIETINSETSPEKKSEIIRRIAAGKCNLLYVSPETLVHRTGIEQLIGDRKIGLVVIDEAHIVTTWGKQFRPDYWYLGDYIGRLRKTQRGESHSFVIAAFTATAIYHGLDDMYEETLSTLQMFDPITYLGRVKRDDIEIVIDRNRFATDRDTKFEDAKFDELKQIVERANIFGEKTLIYFPFVRLVNDAKYFLHAAGIEAEIYHGQLMKDDKRASYENFRGGKNFVMLATKAFGMGIDISDIKSVVHFATPGSVCDYVQEIGRAARAENFSGKACYHYDSRDFRYVKTLHRLSKIRKYQLVELLQKICDLYYQRRGKKFLLVDAENFSYIFDSSDEENAIDKVKLALLIVQKDFELKAGFSPLRVRPCPLYSKGFFKMTPQTKKKLEREYGNCVEALDGTTDIFSVNLKAIWEKNFSDKTFPQFKYLIYSGGDELKGALRELKPALRITVEFKKNSRDVLKNFFDNFRAAIAQSSAERKYFSVEDLSTQLFPKKIPEYKARNACEVLLTTIDAYGKNFYGGGAPLFKKHFAGNSFQYQFTRATLTYFFPWFAKIFDELADGNFYVTDEPGRTKAAEFVAVLGLSEALGALTFNMSGGANNQLAITVLQIAKLKKIADNPNRCQNKILELIEARHQLSVAMLTYIYENDFDSATIWNLLEDYFLGKIPAEVLQTIH